MLAAGPEGDQTCCSTPSVQPWSRPPDSRGQSEDRAMEEKSPRHHDTGALDAMMVAF